MGEIATRHHPSSIKLQLIFVRFLRGSREEGLRFQNHESPVLSSMEGRKELLAFIIFEIFIYGHFKRIISVATPLWRFLTFAEAGSPPKEKG